MSTIYYLAPDHDVPSWGVGLLYHHVEILVGLGFDARVLHEKKPFRLSWLDLEVPIDYLGDGAPRLAASDVLVVPEVLAARTDVDWGASRRVVFVQNSFLLHVGATTAPDYRRLGYEAVLATMPHIRDIVAAHHGLVPTVVPPFVAPYFFLDEDELDRPRRPEVLLVDKPDYRRAGYLDYEIAAKLLERYFARRPSGDNGARWRLNEVSGKTHRQLAEMMRRAALLVSLNTLESLNAVVPEAMAGGCIVACYEAFGGRDFLRSGRNAYVFPNNWVYPLVETVQGLIDGWEERREELATMRAAAYETARSYGKAATAKALGEFFGGLLA